MSFGQEAAQVSSGEIKAGKADKKLAIFLSLAHRQVYSNNFHLGELQVTKTASRATR